nr:DNA repair protein RadC [Pseudoalteromonas sp.]
MNSIIFTPAEKRAITRAKNILAEKIGGYNIKLESPMRVRDFLTLSLGAEEREHFEVIFLTSQNAVIAKERLFSGTINAASVYPREVVKRALELNAANVIFAHNHPSGELEPSQSDKLITKRLQDALGCVDINVLDHLIVSGVSFCSFAERGLL